MLKSGGAVIPMQQNFNDKITYLVGNEKVVAGIQNIPVREPFDDEIIDFLNEISKRLLRSKEAKQYPDVVTLGFWLRKASLLQLKERFLQETNDTVKVGRGVAFHIAPSNVPVNYAYSLVAGLLTGNANIVRIPSKDFPQVELINEAINAVLEEKEQIKAYICLVRYGRENEINDFFSSLSDVRIVWGGDATIAEIRKSPLKPRATEITFADRYSLAVLDSDAYISSENKERIAEEFYNDTFLTDQNACTSPRVVIWYGDHKQEAKEAFWEQLLQFVERKYTFQAIQGINKLTSSYLMAVQQEGTIIEPHENNLIVRVNIPKLDSSVMELKDNSGYFFEYDCEDIMELRDICNNTHCQTIGYLGDARIFIPLLKSGIKGVDRVVPIGKTMDFDMIWDGYNLFERLTRTIVIRPMSI